MNPWPYQVVSPFRLKDEMWPDVRFYKQQCEIIQSVEENAETVVVAGNQLGKDFVGIRFSLFYSLVGFVFLASSPAKAAGHRYNCFDYINKFACLLLP